METYKRSLKVVAWGVGAPLLFAGIFGIGLSYELDKWSIKLPREHDSALVGTWQNRKSAIASEDPPILVSTTFNADGTGSFLMHDGYHPPFEWGTENGVLYTRRMATDAWSGSHWPYRLQGNQITFQGAKGILLVAPTMTRH